MEGTRLACGIKLFLVKLELKTSHLAFTTRKIEYSDKLLRPIISVAKVATNLRQVCDEFNRLDHSQWICDRRIILSHKFLKLR